MIRRTEPVRGVNLARVTVALQLLGYGEDEACQAAPLALYHEVEGPDGLLYILAELPGEGEVFAWLAAYGLASGDRYLVDPADGGCHCYVKVGK